MSQQPMEANVESVRSKFNRAVKMAEELPYEVRQSTRRAIDVGKRHITRGFLEALERYAQTAEEPAAEALRRRHAALKPYEGQVLIGGIIPVSGRQYHLYVDFDPAELIHCDMIEKP